MSPWAWSRRGDTAKAEAARQSALEGLKEITFGELAGFYREWAAANRRSGIGVARILDRHILPELGEKRAADITPAAVNELKALPANRAALPQNRP